MSERVQVDDGDWDSLIEETRDMNFPFSDKGDFDTLEVVIKYKQDKEAYRKLPSMTKMQFPLGTAYLVEQGSPTDAGFGLFEFTRTFSMVPATRTEGALVSFTLSAVLVTGGPINLRVNYPVIAGADMIYEYFIGKPPLVIAPRYYTLASGEGFPARILVQDGDFGIYKGNIWQRVTYYADFKNIRFLPLA